MEILHDLAVRVSIVTLLGACVLPAGASAQGVRPEWSAAALGSNAESSMQHAFQAEGVTGSGLDRKTKTTAMLLSAVWPGAGEFYLGHRTRAIVMSAVEIGGWTAWALNKHKGNDLRTEFRAYADQHWDEAGYRQFIKDWHNDALTAEEMDDYRQQFGVSSPDVYSHALEDEHTQQYYEMIGKYNQFTGFWEGYIPELHAPAIPGHEIVPLRDEYETMRKDHNTYLKRATLGVTIVFLNRVASLIDTMLLIRGRQSGRSLHIHFDTREGSYGAVPTAGLKLKF